MEQRARFPAWLKRSIQQSGQKHSVEALIREYRLHTVCLEAKCPNRCDCFSRGAATFMILGDACTRDCAFCGVKHGAANGVDPDEPRRIVSAAAKLSLSYVVITSVTRDDLGDGGAQQFADTIRLLKSEIPMVRVEVLIPDFRGDSQAMETVLSSEPDVLNHNIETVPRLYSRVRPQADYERSLSLLRRAAQRGRGRIKSGLMVGLGETDKEVVATMRDLHNVGCRVLTIGQYLQPGRAQLPVARFVPPEEFSRYREQAFALGFENVASGPFVRSSYQASESFVSDATNAPERGIDAGSPGRVQ